MGVHRDLVSHKSPGFEMVQHVIELPRLLVNRKSMLHRRNIGCCEADEDTKCIVNLPLHCTFSAIEPSSVDPSPSCKWQAGSSNQWILLEFVHL